MQLHYYRRQRKLTMRVQVEIPGIECFVGEESHLWRYHLEKPAIRLNLLHLLSILFSVVMVLLFQHISDLGRESAPSVVTSSATAVRAVILRK